MAENRFEITIAVDGRDAEQAVQRLRGELGGLEGSTRQAGAGMRDLSASTSDASNSLGGIGGNRSGIDGVGESLRQASQSALGFDGAVGGVLSKLPIMQMALAGVSAVAVKLAINLGNFAEENERAGLSLDAIGRNAGYTSSELRQYEAQLRQANVGLGESREALKQMALAQMDLARADELARVAQDAAIAGNVSREKALQQLIAGIESGKEATLQAIGVDVNFTRAERELAEQLGKTSKELTEQEKLQARLDEALSKGQELAAGYGGELREVDDAMHAATASMEDAKNALGQLFTPAMNAVAQAYYSTIEKLGHALKTAAEFARWLKGDRDQAAVLTGQVRESEARVKALQDGRWNPYGDGRWRDKKEREEAIATELALQQKLQDELEKIRLAGYEKQKQEQDKANAVRIAQAREVAEEETRLANEQLAKLTETKRQALDRQYNALKGKVADQVALERWYNGEVAKLNAASTRNFESEQRKQLTEHEKTRKAMVENERKTIAVMEKWQQDYDNARIKQLGDELDEYLKRQRVAEEEKKKLREKAQKEQEEAAIKTLDRIQGATADVFYTMFKNAGDGWKNLWSSMKDWALKTLAEIAARAAMAKIVVPILTTVTGTGTANAAITALTGGGDTGGSLGSMLGNMPTSSLFGGGSGGLLSKVPGYSAVTGALNTTLPGTSVQLAGPTMSGAPLMGGMSIGSALSYGGWGGLGYTLIGSKLGLPQNKWSGLTASAGGMLGAWGGGALASSAALAGTGMATGAAMGSVIPVVGTIIGAVIGGLASTLFAGGKDHSPSVIFQAQDSAWGQTGGYKFHTKSKADWKTGTQISEGLGQITGVMYEQVEDMLGAYGDKYVGILKDATVHWGRKAGGAWKEWDFGSDKNFEELMGKAAADLKKQIFKAAGPAFSQVGVDFADSDAVKEAYALLGNKTKQFGKIEDAIRKGVQDGNVESYLEQLKGFQSGITTVTQTWKSISDASSQLIEPLSQYEQAQRQLNAQYDGWIAQLTALGIAQENISKIEQGRTDALAKLAEENAKAIQQVVDTSAQAVHPLTELASAQAQVNAQFDGLAAQLKNLGAAAEYAAQVEANRQAALVAAAAQQARTIQYAQAEMTGTVDQYNIREIAQRYKWDDKYIKDGQINRANVQRDAIDWFKSASVKSVQAAAAGHRTTESQIIKDVKYLDDYFKRLDEAAKPKVTTTTTTAVAPRVERINTAVDKTANEFERLTRSLVEFRSQLLTRAESGLTVEERYRAAENEFTRVSQLASLGDKAALERLQEVSDRYLSVSGEYHATANDYRQSSSAVLAALDVGSREAGKMAGADMAALKKEVQQLREEQATANYQLIKWIQSVARISNRWDAEGMPGVRQ